MLSAFPPPKSMPKHLPTEPHWVHDKQLVELILERKFGNLKSPQRTGQNCVDAGDKQPLPDDIEDFEEIKPISQIVTSALNVKKFSSKLSALTKKKKLTQLPPLNLDVKDGPKHAQSDAAPESHIESPTGDFQSGTQLSEDVLSNKTADLHRLMQQLDERMLEIERRESALNAKTNVSSSTCTLL